MKFSRRPFLDNNTGRNLLGSTTSDSNQNLVSEKEVNLRSTSSTEQELSDNILFIRRDTGAFWSPSKTFRLPLTLSDSLDTQGWWVERDEVPCVSESIYRLPVHRWWVEIRRHSRKTERTTDSFYVMGIIAVLQIPVSLFFFFSLPGTLWTETVEIPLSGVRLESPSPEFKSGGRKRTERSLV